MMLTPNQKMPSSAIRKEQIATNGTQLHPSTVWPEVVIMEEFISWFRLLISFFLELPCCRVRQPGSALWVIHANECRWQAAPPPAAHCQELWFCFLRFAYDYPECISASLSVCQERSCAGSLQLAELSTMAGAGDLGAARDQIQREIEALERSLGPDVSSIDVIVSGSSSSDDDSDDEYSDTLDDDYEADELVLEDGGHRAEMCLQMNLVYQAVLQEKLQEVELLISQNKVQQEELLWELAGRKTTQAGSTKPYPSNLSIGHFYKPYFKDKVTGVGPPANMEMIERSSHIVKTFKQLTSRQWRSTDPGELRKAVLSDGLQKILQPKLSKLEYLQHKHDTAKCDTDKTMIRKQMREVEQEISAVNQLPEEALLGKRTDDHDWEKISNVNFEGVHSADRLSKIWQNDLHPHINKADWGEEETKKLQEIAQEHNFVHWEEIAEELGTGRTGFQCLQQFQLNNKDFKRKEFIKEEDEMLTHLVQRMRVGMHIPYHK
ncbi:unnamed protein product, partial [Ranitomeya imitator]